MKKSYIALFCLSMATLLCGCGNATQSQATQSLSNQLERVEKIVGSATVNELSSVSQNGNLDSNTTLSSLQTQKNNSYQNMLREDSLKADILSITSCIKSCTSKPYSLSKTKANAIIQLTNNISKYTTSLNETQPHLQNNVKKITKNLKNGDKLNLTEVESNYISLSNNMNERYAYMSNIYTNLEQIYNLLDCSGCEKSIDCSDCQTGSSQTTDQAETTSQNNTNKDIKNIDTFENTAKNNVVDNNQQTTQNSQLPPPYYTQNGYYGQNNYNFQYNPNRNTDSFYPKMRNIDSYRFNPNNYNYYNNGYYNPQFQNGYYNAPVPNL